MNQESKLLTHDDLKGVAIVSLTLLLALFCIAGGIAVWAYGLPPAAQGGF